jgi:hypothetical protein
LILLFESVYKVRACEYVDFKVGRELGNLWGLGLSKWVKDWVILSYWDCVSGSKEDCNEV